MSPFASRFGRVLLAAVVCATVLPAGDADAQPKSAMDEARELARDGWKALDAANYKEALEKVTQAEALYHAPTHLLLMGNAQAGLGKLADALATFERLTAEPLPAASPPAFKDAQDAGRKRVKELIARVPSLLVAVEVAEAISPVIQVDGQTTNFSGGVAVRLNPGEHTVAVTAEGFVPVETKITLPEKGGVVRLPIALQKKGEPGGSATAQPSASASASASAAPSGSAVVPPGEPSRAPAYVAFGLAGAGILAGAVTGGLSLSMAGELKGVCNDGLCPESERGKLDSATMLAHASTVSFVAAGMAALAGVVLLTVDTSAGAPPPRATAGGRARAGGGVTLQPWISVGGGGLRGRF